MEYLLFRAKQEIKDLIDDESGAGVIELVLIIVVLVGFVFLFKDKIGSLLNTIFSKINSQAESIYQ